MDLRLSEAPSRHRSRSQPAGPSALGFAFFLAVAMGLGILVLLSAASHKLGMQPTVDATEWLATAGVWASSVADGVATLVSGVVSIGKWMGLGVLLLALALTLRGIDWALRAVKRSVGQRRSGLSLSNGAIPLLRISCQDGVLMLRPSLS